MKFSKSLHVLSVISGFVGIGILISSGIVGDSGTIFGFSSEHVLFCSIIMILIAIWLLLGAMHHMILEKKGEIV